MRAVKFMGIMAFLLLAAGCANHAKIDMPVVSKVNADQWHGKSFQYEVFYSQPQPGIFTGGEQQQLKPLNEAQLSVGSAQVLADLPQILADQLPLGAKLTTDGQADYRLKIELIAHDKKGPTYADYEFGKNLAKSFVTLGMGADEYDIVADFDITYFLIAKDGKTYSKAFSVKDSVDHERSAVEFKNNTFDYSSLLLRKHIMITSSDFLQKACNSL